jgi:HD-GYP domain-containing protein (c-di-GMP phosphodiesterase class II)
MIKNPRVPLFDIVMCVSAAADLISHEVAEHNHRVAYIAYRLATELGFEQNDVDKIVIAGALHDVGALTLGDRLSALKFETDDAGRHAELGYHFLRTFEPLYDSARLIRHHHVWWENGAGAERLGEQIPFGTHVVELADRISILLGDQSSILTRAEKIQATIIEKTGKMFVPEFVEAFRNLATCEAFWLDAAAQNVGGMLRSMTTLDTVRLGIEGITQFANVLRRLIDCRCAFTATHSSGVAAVAVELARIAGFSERECQLMRIAGYLHDLGKLAVPSEIILKPGSLTKDEFDKIKRHPYQSFRVLAPIAELETVNEWASLHHERLDGNGYPFHLSSDEIPLGARIMAVADVLTAITEERPYRKAMSQFDALSIIERAASNGQLDRGIAELVTKDFEHVDAVRREAQTISEDLKDDLVACRLQA